MPSTLTHQCPAGISFQSYQRRFVRYLREPCQGDPLDRALPAHVDVYAKLLYQKFEDSLSTCFPVTKELLGGTRWKRLVEAFIAQHRCASPFYRQIPDEFVTYLNARPFGEDDPPFLAELAHYEWLELILAIAPDQPIEHPLDPAGDLLLNRPTLTPVLHVQGYRWPVQTIAPTQPGWDHWRTWQKSAARPEENSHYILAFRDSSDEVRLIEINGLTARLIELFKEARRSGREALLDLAAEARFLDLASFIPFGEQTLNQLRDWGAILGTERP